MLNKKDKENNKPEIIFRSGLVKATVWSNEIEVDGNKKNMRSVQLQKSYKTKDGEWGTTNTYN